MSNHLRKIECLVTTDESEDLESSIKKVSLPYPPGLQNLGNTCYINATLQCLLTIKPLVDWLIDSPDSQFRQLPENGTPTLTSVLSKLVVAIFRQEYNSELVEFRRVIGEIVKVCSPLCT